MGEPLIYQHRLFEFIINQCCGAGAATFAGAGAITLIQFLAPAPAPAPATAPCYKLGILKSFIVTDSASCIFVHGHPFLTVY